MWNCLFLAFECFPAEMIVSSVLLDEVCRGVVEVFIFVTSVVFLALGASAKLSHLRRNKKMESDF